MDEGKILLINLSSIGSDEREILGCFMLSLLHQAALSRSEMPENMRRQFHVHVDEAHRFITEAIENLIAETRKFGVSLTLAHHYFSQFGTKKIDALSSVGTTIIMNVDTKDGRYLTKDLQGLVKYRDAVYEKLKEWNVYTRRYFYPLLCDYACYRSISVNRSLPVARRVANRILTLPIYDSLELSDVETICEITLSLHRGDKNLMHVNIKPSELVTVR